MVANSTNLHRHGRRLARCHATVTISSRSQHGERLILAPRPPRFPMAVFHATAGEAVKLQLVVRTRIVIVDVFAVSTVDRLWYYTSLITITIGEIRPAERLVSKMSLRS